MLQTTNLPNPLSTASIGADHEWLSATGPLLIPMTNDYLFRALLQRNNQVLKALICSLLHLPIEQVRSVAIINPILLGESIDEKTFFLDVFVVLNNHTRINLELQVINEHNWPERSLSYLCRTFDNLNSGESYSVVKPAIQIGLLDFTLFPEHPEFYSTYQFLNIKNHTIYSDKIRLQCEAREDYYRRQRSVQYNLDKLDKQKDTIEIQNATIEKQNADIEKQNTAIKQLTDKVTSQETELTSLRKEIMSLRKLLSDVLESTK